MRRFKTCPLIIKPDFVNYAHAHECVKRAIYAYPVKRAFWEPLFDIIMGKRRF